METLVGIIGMGVLAMFGWAFTLNSRVAVLEADKVSLKELIDAKLQAIMQEQHNQSTRLARIEAKLDQQSV